MLQAALGGAAGGAPGRKKGGFFEVESGESAGWIRISSSKIGKNRNLIGGKILKISLD